MPSLPRVLDTLPPTHEDPSRQNASAVAIATAWEAPLFHNGGEDRLVAGEQLLDVGEAIPTQRDEEVGCVQALLLEEGPNAPALAPLGTRAAWMAGSRSPLRTKREH